MADANLDEIRRDLFHAPSDKVCAHRLHDRHVPALLAEVERLRDGIRRHREAIYREVGEDSAIPYDHALWALLDDRTETT